MKHKHCGRKFCPADNLPAAGIDPAFRAAHLESCRDATSRGVGKLATRPA